MIRAWLALFATLAAAPAHAQSCEGTPIDMLRDALEKHEATETATAAVAAARAEAKESLTDSTTGPAISGAAAATTITNFLPLFSLAGLSGDLFGNTDSIQSNDDLLSFDFNIPLRGGGADARELKLQAAFNREPQPFEPLLAAVPESDRFAFREALEDDLDFSDDASFSLIYNVNSELLGRNRRLLDDIYTNVLQSVDSSAYQQAFARVKRLFDSIPTREQVRPFEELQLAPDSATNEARKTELCTTLQQYLAEFGAQAAMLTRTEDLAVRRSGIETFAQLVNNQPQLHGGLTFRERDPAVGPDEISLVVTFEWGYRANVNGLRRFVEQRCASSNADGCLLDGYAGYLGANQSAITSGDRLKFSLEYVDMDDYDFGAEGDSFMFSMSAEEKFITSVAYGRDLSGTGLMSESRIDLEFKYEDVGGDPARNDRAIGVLTLTKPLGGIFLPFSIVYSNKAEFTEMDVDEKISAHIGIKYEFDTE